MGNASGVGREAPTFTITAPTAARSTAGSTVATGFPVLVFVPTQE